MFKKFLPLMMLSMATMAVDKRNMTPAVGHFNSRLVYHGNPIYWGKSQKTKHVNKLKLAKKAKLKRRLG